jgi:hypothetical protein
MSMPSLEDTNQTVLYFGFGTNKDLAMMEHMIGRNKIEGTSGVLIGYEVCIQRTDQFRTEIPPTTPYPVSPRDLILKSWGPKFEMYVSRPNPIGLAYGTIWTITPEELELVREWELVDYGAQEDAWGIAIDEDENKHEVVTQSFMRPPIDIDRVVEGKNYPAYIWPKEVMLKRADELREQYLRLKADGKS